MNVNEMVAFKKMHESSVILHTAVSRFLTRSKWSGTNLSAAIMELEKGFNEERRLAGEAYDLLKKEGIQI